VVSAIPPPPAIANRDDGEPDVVLIAVTHNSAVIIDSFVQALPGALEDIDSAKVLVVDNASRDRTVERIRQMAPWIIVLESGENLGYGGGINLGLRHLRGRRGVMVLNPDTRPAAGSVKRLLAAVESDDHVGIAVPLIVDSSGRLSYSLRREPTIRRAFGEAILGGRRAANFPSLGEVIRDPGYYVDGAAADWATGAAMFLSRRTLDAVGFWAEDFFLYSEETDYALRARDAQLGLRLVTSAMVAHDGGEMTRSPWLWSIRAVNRTRLYRRRHGRATSMIYWSAVVLNEATRAVLGRATHRAALRALLTGHPPSRDSASGVST
jgi:N-acetylglucosaminyl-diphospho-decaprenol L-rhamnosyltransferase